MHGPAPKASYARLWINGKFEGVFAEVEHVGGRFTKFHHFPDAEATIYRCPRNDCEMKTYRAPFQSNWIKKTNLGESDDVLHGLLDAINHTPEPDFARMLEDTFDLEIYLRAMAVDALISMNITEGSGSYVIYDRRMGRWVYVPWDMNNADVRWQMGTKYAGGHGEPAPAAGERVRNGASARGRGWRWVAFTPASAVSWDNTKLGR